MSGPRWWDERACGGDGKVVQLGSSRRSRRNLLRGVGKRAEHVNFTVLYNEGAEEAESENDE